MKICIYLFLISNKTRLHIYGIAMLSRKTRKLKEQSSTNASSKKSWIDDSKNKETSCKSNGSKTCPVD